MTTDQLLTKLESIHKLPDFWDRDHLRARFTRIESSIDPSTLTQDQFVRLFEIYRNDSWDIPSALMAICSGLTIAILHRDTKDYPRPNSLIADWDIVDLHFKIVHRLDLTDHRINWSFDT